MRFVECQLISYKFSLGKLCIAYKSQYRFFLYCAYMKEVIRKLDLSLSLVFLLSWHDMTFV